MSPEEPGIAALTGLKARAAGLSDQLSNGPLEEQRGILHAIIQRIDLTPASIVLILHKTALARLLDLPYAMMIRAAFPFVFPSVSGAEAWKPR